MNFKTLEEVNTDLLRLANGQKTPLAIMMGLSGAGKSHLSAELSKINPRLLTVSFDWWIKDPSNLRRAQIARDYEKNGTMPNPLSWYDWEQFKTDLTTLRSSGMLKRKGMWNQHTGEKDLAINLSLPKEGIILVEGMYLMENGMDQLVDYVIIVLTEPDQAIRASSARRAQPSENTYREVKARWIREYDAPYIERYVNSANAVIANEH